MSLTRYLSKYVLGDIDSKIILLSGARQVGKTTLSKNLGLDFQYLNYDNDDHKLLFKKMEWDREKQLLIFDELHKMDNWKRWLKGIYDVEGLTPKILVTGSARLETYTNVGDSLAGRFFAFRLHPFDLWELSRIYPEEDKEKLLKALELTGGFPEPFLKGNRAYHNRWAKTHLDTILREDFLGLVEIRDIHKLRLLIELLRERVGSPVSHSALAEDLQVSYKTVQRWIELLEKLYIIFKVTPYHANIARSLLKSSKYYFYNCAYVKSGKGAAWENLVACALLKRVHYYEDIEGRDGALYYIRTKDGKEIDFMTVVDEKATLVEVKYSDENFSEFLLNLEISNYQVTRVQVVRELYREKSTQQGARMVKATNWLSEMPLL